VRKETAMGGSVWRVSEYKLTDLLSAAGATIGVIIAGTIFLQFLSTKYTELSSRYREMALEYRGRRQDEPRHGPLQGELRLYRRRLRLMHLASCLAAIAQMCFLAAVLAGGLSMLYPPQRAFKFLGTAGLFSGLLMMAAAVAIEFVEILLSRSELAHETADLDDLARGG
jgi:uncharacterized membrane protein YraQ (UPF0718 family)